MTSTVTGLVYAGDANYGPLVDGARQEGSDFNDYRGTSNYNSMQLSLRQRLRDVRSGD